MDQETIQSAKQAPSNPTRRFRRFVEFQGVHHDSARQYRDRIRDLYDGPAGAVLAIGSMLSLHEPLVGHMLRKRQFDASRFRSILDVGSGAGQILGHLLKEIDPQAHVVAFDLSQQMLRRARGRIRDPRPRFVAGDLMRMPFQDESFDCITCGWVLEHLQDPFPGLAEIHRVLRPGGSILMLATEDTVQGAFVSRTWKCRTYNRDELRDACISAGLPWKEQLWFSPVHRFFRIGGILVEATKG